MINPSELIVDNFAGGGGASLGIELALGRPVDIAINHDPEAVALHRANHPATRHLCQSVWRADPYDVVEGRPVGLAWFSPDCKHFSKAKGGKPVEKRIRDLAWVVVLWARTVRPRVIMLENVEEFATWGPLLEDGSPCPARRGTIFRRWIGELRRLGYRVEWRELRACDYGAPTIRKRLFLVARRDGQPIVWPAPTHGPGLLPYRTAAECIDWSLPAASIFGRAKPLAEATLRRIARGVVRHVLGVAEPFIVTIDHQSNPAGHAPADAPLSVVTAKARHAVVCPTLIQTGYGERPGQAPRAPGLDKPLGTIVAGGAKHAVVAAFLAQHNGGVVGRDARDPLSTLTQGCSHQQPVLCHLSDADREGAERVAAFLVKYYDTAVGQPLTEPLHTITTKARFGLVTVRGVPVVDITMRMLAPREAYRAQSFPDSYRIDVPGPDGRPLSKAAQFRMCGNSVCPEMAASLVRANFGATERRIAA